MSIPPAIISDSFTICSAARSECAARVEAMRTLFAHGPGEPVFVDTSGLQLPVAAGGAAREDAVGDREAADVAVRRDADGGAAGGVGRGADHARRRVLGQDQRVPAQDVVDVHALRRQDVDLRQVARCELEVALDLGAGDDQRRAEAEVAHAVAPLVQIS